MSEVDSWSEDRYWTDALEQVNRLRNEGRTRLELDLDAISAVAFMGDGPAYRLMYAMLSIKESVGEQYAGFKGAPRVMLALLIRLEEISREYSRMNNENRIDTEKIYDFSRTLEGQVLETRTQKKQFSVEVRDDALIFTPLSGKKIRRSVDREKLERILDEFARTKSFKCKDYFGTAWSSSYVLTLIGRYLDNI